MSHGRDRDGEPLADVEIGAAARAKRVRFKRRPRTQASLEAGPDGRSESRSEREGLPEEIEPGKTYHDVRVAWRGGARLSLSQPPP